MTRPARIAATAAMARLARLAVPATLAAAGSAAFAHTGHGAEGLGAGLAHPLGADHLLAMVAVGLWSALATARAQRVLGPLVFLLGLLAGTFGSQSGPLPPLAEHGIAASVVLLGALVFAPRALPRGAALLLIGLAGVMHGLAHGAEAPVAGFAAYVTGLLLASAALQATGLLAGMRLASLHAAAWRLAGVALGLAGCALLAAA